MLHEIQLGFYLLSRAMLLVREPQNRALVRQLDGPRRVLAGAEVRYPASPWVPEPSDLQRFGFRECRDPVHDEATVGPLRNTLQRRKPPRGAAADRATLRLGGSGSLGGIEAGQPQPRLTAGPSRVPRHPGGANVQRASRCRPTRRLARASGASRPRGRAAPRGFPPPRRGPTSRRSRSATPRWRGHSSTSRGAPPSPPSA